MPYIGPSLPTEALLHTSASAECWTHAKKQAQRSPMLRYKTGCVIWDPSTREIVSKGCSHPDIKYSKILAAVHAERHAISNRERRSLEGCWAVILTLNGKGGGAWSSRPCYSCAHALLRADIERVIYPERTASGKWTIQSLHPEEITGVAPAPTGIYARQQRTYA